MRQCKKCHTQQSYARRKERYTPEELAAAQREYNRRRPPEKRLDGHLKSRYGLSLVEFRELEAAQDHRCAICGRVLEELREQRRTGAHVDHSHATGKVRGLLCSNCNRGLGCYKDDPKLLAAAAAYLENDGVPLAASKNWIARKFTNTAKWLKEHS